MKLHNFSKSLAHEREQCKTADLFYTNILCATSIRRFNTDSKLDMEMQRQDVDLEITIENVTYKISEKYRDRDFKDLYIELYSKYPLVKGWMDTGSPNAILYFTPQNIYWITHKSLSAFYTEKLLPAIKKEWIDDELIKPEKAIIEKKVRLGTKTHKINIIQSRNFDGAGWVTIGISVPFYVLKDFGVKFKQFKNPQFT